MPCGAMYPGRGEGPFPHRYDDGELRSIIGLAEIDSELALEMLAEGWKHWEAEAKRWKTKLKRLDAIAKRVEITLDF